MKTILQLGRGKVQVSCRRAKRGQGWLIVRGAWEHWVETKQIAVRTASGLHRASPDQTYTVQPST